MSLPASLAALDLEADGANASSPSANAAPDTTIYKASKIVPKAEASAGTSNHVHDMPTEMLEEVCNKLLMPDHFYFATCSKTLYSKCRHTLRASTLKLRGKYHTFGLLNVERDPIRWPRYPGHVPKRWRSLPSFFDQIHQDNAFSYVETLNLARTMAHHCRTHPTCDDHGRPASQEPITQLRARLRSMFLEEGIEFVARDSTLASNLMFKPCNTIQSFQILLIPLFANLRKIVLPNVRWTYIVKRDLQRLLHFVAKQEHQTLLPRLHTVQWQDTQQAWPLTFIPLVAIPSVRKLLVSNLVYHRSARSVPRWPCVYRRSRVDYVELIDCHESLDWVRQALLQNFEGPCLVKITQASRDGLNVIKDGTKCFSLALIGVCDSHGKWQRPPKIPRTKQEYVALFTNDMEPQEREILLNLVTKYSPELIIHRLPKSTVEPQVTRMMIVISFSIRSDKYISKSSPYFWNSEEQCWKEAFCEWDKPLPPAM